MSSGAARPDGAGADERDPTGDLPDDVTGDLAEDGAAPLADRLPAAALLAAAALDLGLAAVRAVQLLLGDGPAFLRTDPEPADTYAKVSYLVQAEPPVGLALPLVALGLLAWLGRRDARLPRGLRAAAVATAALAAALGVGDVVLGLYLAVADPPSTAGLQLFTGDRFSALTPVVAGGLLVLAVAGVLAQVLRAPAAQAAAALPEAPRHDPPPVRAEPDALPDAPPVPPRDPHARFRREPP